MLRAYPASPSVPAGGTLTLHVAGDATRFTVTLERWPGGIAVLQTGPFAAHAAPPGAPDAPWEWPAVEIVLPPDLPSGAYVVRLRPEGGTAAPRGPRDGSPDARWGTALVAVRGTPAARVLVNLPVFTYHAYNVADVDGTRREGEGACLYSGARTVTLCRPGGGTGGHPWDEVNVDVYDRTSPRQTFAHWDLPGLAWFASERIAVDVCTDVDLQRGDVDLERYAVLCSFGHDEYWTREKRERVESYVEAGGNVAFFGGNTCWFRVRWDDARATITRDGKWGDDFPEDTLTGLSYRRGGGKWIGARPPTGYRVEDPAHPLLRDAHLAKSQLVGAGAYLVGYECDGIDAQFAPPGLAVLGRATLDGWTVGDGSGELAPGAHAACVALRRGRGWIFNAGTVDWSRALAWGDAPVRAITRSVVRRLSERASG